MAEGELHADVALPRVAGVVHSSHLVFRIAGGAEKQAGPHIHTMLRSEGSALALRLAELRIEDPHNKRGILRNPPKTHILIYDQKPSILKEPMAEGTNDSTVCTSASMTSGATLKRREVSFDTIQIRHYSMELGDNPSCSIGAPVTLSWDFEEEEPRDIDIYECERGCRRRVRNLVLNYYQRQSILSHAGYSEAELKSAERALNKIKRQRGSTQFFMPVARMGEAVRGAGRKVKKTVVKS